jgi:hypothetical protein
MWQNEACTNGEKNELPGSDTRESGWGNFDNLNWFRRPMAGARDKQYRLLFFNVITPNRRQF